MIREVKKSCGIFIASKLRRAILLIYVSMSEPFQQEKKKTQKPSAKTKRNKIEQNESRFVESNSFTPRHGGLPICQTNTTCEGTLKPN